MKRIYLIRHAKSTWDVPGVADHDRALNERGRHDAPAMGRHLRQHNHLPDAILTSTALRAVSTAEAIAEQLHFPSVHIIQMASIYHAGPKEYYVILSGLDDIISSVCIVGHNPTISEFASSLTGTAVGSMPTCAVFCAECDIESWKDISDERHSRVILYETPKSLRNV